MTRGGVKFSASERWVRPNRGRGQKLKSFGRAKTYAGDSPARVAETLSRVD